MSRGRGNRGYSVYSLKPIPDERDRKRASRMETIDKTRIPAKKLDKLEKYYIVLKDLDGEKFVLTRIEEANTKTPTYTWKQYRDYWLDGIPYERQKEAKELAKTVNGYISTVKYEENQ